MATTERDYYDVLGVPRNASDAEIKRSFRRLARELHPDVNGAADAEQRFRSVAEAYQVLSDPERRQTYDRFGHAGLRRGGFRPADFDLGNLSDIFAAFFGEGLFGTPSRGSRPSRGADITAVAEITLHDAFAGVSLSVPIRAARTCAECGGSGAEAGTTPVTCTTCSGAGRVQHVSQSAFGQFVRTSTCPTCDGLGRVVESPCPRCDGAGRVLEERTLDVEVPAGIHDGQRIRLRGEGHAGGLGGAGGDVFVQVRIRPDEHLQRDGDDLIAAVALTMTQAALGFSVTVSTPAGEQKVELPPGTQPGDVRVLHGGGMPSLQTGRRGDLRVVVEVRVPTRLTPEQREGLLRVEESLGEEAYRDDDGFFRRLKSAFR